MQHLPICVEVGAVLLHVAAHEDINIAVHSTLCVLRGKLG